MNLRTVFKPMVQAIGRPLGLQIVGKREWPDGFAREVLLNLLPKVETVFDVGANIGQSATRFRRSFPEAHIYSFEPNRAAFAQLKSQVGTDPKITLEEAAVSSSNGTITFVDDPLSVLSHIDPTATGGKGREVRCVTLDTYCAEKKIERIDLLKVDTEGHDLEVIDGAKSLFERNAIGCVVLEFGGAHQLNLLGTDIDRMAKLNYELAFTFESSVIDGKVWYGNGLFVPKDLVHKLRP